MTLFSASEEKPIEQQVLHCKLYFTMPDALQAAGGDVSSNSVDFDPHVVEDRGAYHGTEPALRSSLAAKLVAALDRATVPA